MFRLIFAIVLTDYVFVSECLEKFDRETAQVVMSDLTDVPPPLNVFRIIELQDAW